MAWRRRLRVCLAALLLSAALAQTVTGMRLEGVPYAPAAAVARALGDIVVAGDGSLTWRAAGGTLTVFDGSPDALWKADGASEVQTVGLSAPAALRAGRWWLPLDALEIVGVRVDGTRLAFPDGSTLTLALPEPAPGAGDGRSRVDDLGSGVRALRLFSAGTAGPEGGGAARGAAGGVTATDANVAGVAAAGTPTAGVAGADANADGVSAMLADLDMLPLVDPAERSVIDAALEGSAPDKPVLVVVTALRDGTWQPTFTLAQAGRSLEFRYPYRMRLVEGSPARVGPGAPASVLLLLPPWFDLHRPITVSWQGVSGAVTFRR